MSAVITPYYRSSLLTNLPAIAHGFWGRRGGVSSSYFESLNVGRYKGDDDANVLANRKIILNELGQGDLCLLNQVHGTRVVWVDKPIQGEIDADAMVTRTKGLFLGVMTADCIPLLMAHPRSETIAAVHAGWKGTVAGIVSETLRMMDVPVHEVLVAIGPCIWQISYTVGQDVYDAAGEPLCFLSHPSEEGKYLYDLHGHMVRQLKRAGVERISPSPANTYALPEDYFSFRRKTHLQEPACGNQLSAIGMLNS